MSGRSSPTRICILEQSDNPYKHIFAAQNDPRHIICIEKPVKDSSLDKYFIDDSDLSTIKQSIKIPFTTHAFDAVFRRTTESSKLFEDLYDAVANAIDNRQSISVGIQSVFDDGIEQLLQDRHNKLFECIRKHATDHIYLKCSITIDGNELDLLTLNDEQTQPQYMLANDEDIEEVYKVIVSNLQSVAPAAVSIDFKTSTSHITLTTEDHHNDISIIYLHESEQFDRCLQILNSQIDVSTIIEDINKYILSVDDMIDRHLDVRDHRHTIDMYINKIDILIDSCSTKHKQKLYRCIHRLNEIQQHIDDSRDSKTANKRGDNSRQRALDDSRDSKTANKRGENTKIFNKQRYDHIKNIKPTSYRSSASKRRPSYKYQTDSSEEEAAKVTLIDRIRNDIKECDRLHHMKTMKIVRDKNLIDSTNKQMTTLIKEMKQQIDQQKQRYGELDTKHQLLQQKQDTLQSELNKKEEAIAQHLQDIDRYKHLISNSNSDINEIIDNRDKLIADHQNQIDKFKEELAAAQTSISQLQSTVNAKDLLIADHKSSVLIIQKDVDHLKEDIQRHKQQQLADADKIEKMTATISDLKVAMQHEDDKYQQLYESYHHLVDMDKRRQQEIDELHATIKDKDESAADVSRERDELKERNLHYEHKLGENIKLMDEMKTRLDDTKLQLSSAMHRIDDMLKDKDAISNLKRSIESKDESIRQLQEKVSKFDIEAVHYQHSLERLQSDSERHQAMASEMKTILEKKDLDILTMVEERDDLFQKANDLEQRLLAMDRIQTEDIDRLEKHVDDIVAQLGMARRDNEQLAQQAADLRLHLEAAEHRLAEAREKYYHKKSEVNVLRDKSDRLASENQRLAAQVSQLAASSKQSANATDHRHKAYRDIKSIIDEFKHQP